jgi:restriction system protein
MKTKLKILDLHTPAANDDVAAALNLLRDALDEEQQRINHEGAAAMQEGEYDTAIAVIDFGKRLLSLKEKVGGIAAEWGELENLRDKATPAVQEIVSKRFFGKKKKGEITPHSAYCPFILQALVEMGGSGKTRFVLDRVGEKMKHILKPIDYDVLPSDRKTIRWRNSAQWARSDMVHKDGRMKKRKDGIWEISDKGRKWLAEQKKSK